MTKPIKENNEVSRILEHIGISEENPNAGTKAKKDLITKVLSFCIDRKEGKYSQWIAILTLKFNLSNRTLKENYLEPLITSGILEYDNSRNEIKYIGIPEIDKPENKLTEKEQENFINESMKDVP